MNINYSKICNHSRLGRIDNNFVRCLDCGQSMISQKQMISNKTSKDFTNENKYFTKNFDRNFTNVFEEVDEQSSRPLYEYYTDRTQSNHIIVNKQVQFLSNPPKYEVSVNGTTSYLTNEQILKMLGDIGAIRVDHRSLWNLPGEDNIRSQNYNHNPRMKRTIMRDD